MKRDEALLFLKEVLNENPYMAPQTIILNQTKEPNDYTVNIKEIFSAQILRDLALKHNLSVKEEKDTMVVYQPTA